MQDEELDISPVDMDDALVIEEEDISDDDDEDEDEDVSIPSPVCTLLDAFISLANNMKDAAFRNNACQLSVFLDKFAILS